MKKIFLLSISFLSFWVAGSQSAVRIEAGPGQSGNVIYYHGPLPLGAKSEIVRTDAGGKEKAFPIAISGSVNELKKKAAAAPDVFRYLLDLPETAATKLNTALVGAMHTDDLPMYNLPMVAFACGLAIVDKDATPESTYRFRNAAGWQGEAVSARPKNPDWTSVRAKALGQGDHSANVRLGWLVPPGAKENLLGVVVYRSVPFEDKFEPIPMLRGFQNQSDSLIATARDTSKRVLGSWHYAIRMVDRFGSASAVSEVILAHNFPPESQPMFTYFKAIGRSDKPAVDLQWKLDNAFRARAVRVYRSRQFDGPFELITTLGPQQTSYTDAVDDLMEAYVYQLEAEDLAAEANVRSARHPAVSEFKALALPVTDLKADTLDIDIRISWTGNPPLDRGYYVARTEGYDATQLQIVSPFIPASRTQAQHQWTDRDTTLRGDRFYTYGVITESHSYLKGEVDETAAQRPRRSVYVPTPNRCNLRQDDDQRGYTLTWQHVGTLPEYNNHFGYAVFARAKDAVGGFKEITTAPVLLDTNWYHLAKADPTLEYAVRALDIFGNKSAFSPTASISSAFLNDFGPRFLRSEPIDDSRVELRWVRPTDPRAKGYQLYMTDGESDPVVVGKFSIDQLKHTVTPPDKGRTNYYFIVALDADGRPGSPSEWLTVLP